MAEVKVALQNMEALIAFYEEHERWEDMERILEQRVEVPLRMAELRVLGEHFGPKAAMREYYRATDRPERAIELELAGIEQAAGKLAARKASLDARLAQLQHRREQLEHQTGKLHERRQRLEDELREMHLRAEAERADELELAVETLPTKVDQLSGDLMRIDKSLENGGLPPERRERLEHRRHSVTDELREVKQHQTHVRRELKQHRNEMRQRSKRHQADAARRLKEELTHLQAEKREIRNESKRSRVETEARLQHLERRIAAVKKQLDRKPQAKPQKALPKVGCDAEPAKERKRNNKGKRAGETSSAGRVP